MKTVLKSNCCHAEIIKQNYNYCKICRYACNVIEEPDINEINIRLELLEKAINELKKTNRIEL